MSSMVNANRFSRRTHELVRAALGGVPQRQAIQKSSTVEFAIALQREISLQGFEHVDTRMTHRGCVQVFRREVGNRVVRLQVVEKGTVLHIEMM